ncbi:MAG: class I SAM-dependent methyltransferase [Zetaproteobacteria bacterium]|nr:class I SAM-dependent methyltransferase [Zetaproteobacteria bacterium]
MRIEQRTRIVNRHRDSLKRHGYHANALYWSSKAVQESRFEVLARIGMAPGESLLDVGCGFADFYGWSKKHLGGALHYTGVDLSPDLLDVAKKHHPDLALHCGELADFVWPPHAFDWVVMSGSLSEALGDQGENGRNTVAEAFVLSQKGVAFNMLSIHDPYMAAASDLQAYDPHEMVTYCQSMCDDVVLIDDYLSCDFTIFMRRQ